jgi:hypothetical protein
LKIHDTPSGANLSIGAQSNTTEFAGWTDVAPQLEGVAGYYSNLEILCYAQKLNLPQTG